MQNFVTSDQSQQEWETAISETTTRQICPTFLNNFTLVVMLSNGDAGVVDISGGVGGLVALVRGRRLCLFLSFVDGFEFRLGCASVVRLSGSNGLSIFEVLPVNFGGGGSLV